MLMSFAAFTGFSMMADCQLIRFYDEQFAGVGGFFVVLGNGEQRGLHHFAESGCFQV